MTEVSCMLCHFMAPSASKGSLCQDSLRCPPLHLRTALLCSLQQLQQCSPEAHSTLWLHLPATPPADPLHGGQSTLASHMVVPADRTLRSACNVCFKQPVTTLLRRMLLSPCIWACASTGQAMLPCTDAQLLTVEIRPAALCRGTGVCGPNHAVLHTVAAAGYQLQTILIPNLLQGCQPAQPKPCCPSHPSTC